MNKVAVITGASSGIGRATAKLLVQKGYKVYDLSRTERAQDCVVHIDCDVTQKESVQKAISTINDTEKRIDLLILCAGYGIAGAIEYTSDEEMLQQYDVNVFGAIRVVREALPIMRVQEKLGCERGRIVFVGSLAGIFAIPYQSMYSATKAAIQSYAFSLANEVNGFGIHVTCLLPGDVNTGFTTARKTNLLGADIYPAMTKSIEQMEKDEQHGMSAEACARQLVRAATCRWNKPYHTINLLSWFERILYRILPSEICRKVVGWLYHT